MLCVFIMNEVMRRNIKQVLNTYIFLSCPHLRLKDIDRNSACNKLSILETLLLIFC